MDSYGKEISQPTLNETFEAQAIDCTCSQAALTIVIPKYMFTFSTEGALAWIWPIDGALQLYISTRLRTRIIFLHHCYLLAGHTVARQLCDTMRQNFHWSHMANNVFNTVVRCLSRTSTFRTNKNQTKIRLFPLAGALKFVFIDVLDPLLKIERGSRYIVAKTIRLL